MDWWEVGKQINRDYYGPRLLEASGLGALFPEATINWEYYAAHGENVLLHVVDGEGAHFARIHVTVFKDPADGDWRLSLRGWKLTDGSGDTESTAGIDL